MSSLLLWWKILSIGVKISHACQNKNYIVLNNGTNCPVVSVTSSAGVQIAKMMQKIRIIAVYCSDNSFNMQQSCLQNSHQYIINPYFLGTLCSKKCFGTYFYFNRSLGEKSDSKQHDKWNLVILKTQERAKKSACPDRILNGQV